MSWETGGAEDPGSAFAKIAERLGTTEGAVGWSSIACDADTASCSAGRWAHGG